MGSTLTCVLALIGGIVCGAISASIMKSKGRSEGVGWILGLLIGIFGLIIVALLPKNEEGIEQNMLQSGSYKLCPYCRKLIDRQAIICPYCRSQL
ncbi:MAG: zinc ribbon domain-containing protein [Anaerolineaceae bacterium]